MEVIVNFLSMFVVGMACFDLIKAIINKNGVGDAYLFFLTFVPTLFCDAAGTVGQIVGTVFLLIMFAINHHPKLHAKFWEPAFPNG